MNSREAILAAVKKNQPALSPLPDISMFKVVEADIASRYTEVFTGIGGQVIAVSELEHIKPLLSEHFDISRRTVTALPELSDVAELINTEVDPHSFDDVELAIIRARLAVAENGAVWLTESVMGQRIIPYICQHLAVVVTEDSLVSTMHDAYEKIASGDYGFGGFIGGPSKTADIEQALVLGAHGPLSMTIFLIKQ
ncbi:MAG TPA: LUD domain-containing protein [Daejeonella sp.]